MTSTAGRTWQDDAKDYWRGVRGEFASGKRKFTIIKPQPLAHERIPLLEAEIVRLKAEIDSLRAAKTGGA
ncbi:hypothetical protein [Afipia clevelandensis]|uniref:Uncharacterized protein n=1 Tax=Afipia clevelandensis ATCC 49720 TaxID=883079 RepID=K8PE08_9BRAD|nr:hypothetical protein [Afipia clevelandensis]EKS37795.1 hypothetical protein HMPREF9696_01745 [Afipia clevelandensis ATCC 49720]